MKKEELVAKLEGCKEYTNTVSIDFVLVALGMLEEPKAKTGITQELADKIADKIERCLDYNSNDLVDKDNITFEIAYGNTIEVEDVSIDVSETMDHITSILSEFVKEEEDDEVDLQVEAYNENFGSKEAIN